MKKENNEKITVEELTFEISKFSVLSGTQTKVVEKAPRIRLAHLEFKLSNQDSAGEENRPDVHVARLTRQALKSGIFSH